MSDSVTMGRHDRLVMATGAYRALTARLVAPWALQGQHPHGDVLEIGAGAGAMAHHLLRTTPDLHLVATDVDPDMCAAASRVLGAFAPRVTVQQADANDLPFADGSFDFVLSFLMLHHTGDWQRTVREAMRVLRPGGRFVGFDLVAGAPLHHPKRFHTLMRRGELEALLQAEPTAARASVRPGLAGALVRFVATRA